MLHKSKKYGTPPKSQHRWGEKVYVRLHKNSIRDAYDRITQFIKKKGKWLCLVPTGQTGLTDRSDRSAPDSQPKTLHQTICITLSQYHLDRMIKSITLINTQYKCTQVHKLDKVRDYYKFQSSKAQTGQTGLSETESKKLWIFSLPQPLVLVLLPLCLLLQTSLPKL